MREYSIKLNGDICLKKLLKEQAFLPKKKKKTHNLRSDSETLNLIYSFVCRNSEQNAQLPKPPRVTNLAKLWT